MLKHLLIITAASLLFSLNVNAQNVCSSSASDSDGDGWGWEYGQSCAVTTPDTPASSGSTCNNAGSDPDGDGWGWENGASCRTPVYSEQTPQTSGIADFSSSLVGAEAGTHTFTLTTAASVLFSNLATYNLEAQLYGPAGNLIWTDADQYSNPCFPAGTYTVQFSNRYFSNSLEPVNYTISLTDRNISCVVPSSTVNLGFGAYYGQMTRDGTVLSNTIDNNLGVTAFDRYGTKLWAFPDATYFSSGESTPDGSILLSYNDANFQPRLALIEINGTVRWRIEAEVLFDNIAVNNNVAAFNNNQELIAINLNNGSTKFSYDFGNLSPTDDVVILDDGSILQSVVDQNGAVLVLTFH